MTTHLAHEHEVTHCHNCGAAVQYHYCSLCGQETRLHVASAGEFVHEFIGHYVALEGKLWETLRFLMLRPGFLSAEYIGGRRKRYIEPLRVYLTLSLLFFAVLKLGGPPVVDVAGDPGAAAPRAAQVAPRGTAVTSPEEQAMRSAAAIASPALENKVNAFLQLSSAEKNRALQGAFFKYVPYAMFLLMPLFALYLKLLYLGSGRHYGEHFLFALHSNAFAFGMFSVIIVVGFAGIALLTFACVVWLFAWLPMAMQRVYGGPRWLTFVRWQALSVLHLISIAAAIMGAMGIAVVA
ncbi:DUF3667 domain-containing protein [Massilia sp. PAMC28688]|uniref:DUF3667 domain-containing protein n=1 Tax=Massilia sp. PAMC28688 TaxID=2861283 RepID=UPI001C626B75|nr:DUF3667 domain-containing protein [Massilia sp. PAMC28688]QYF95623.1 DUF3667 domain-containing protein [Massilia sp. PAMC28688]